MAFYGHLVRERKCDGHYAYTSLSEEELQQLFPSVEFLSRRGETNRIIRDGQYAEIPSFKGWRVFRLVGNCPNLTDEGTCNVWDTDMLPPWCNTSNGNPEMM